MHPHLLRQFANDCLMVARKYLKMPDPEPPKVISHLPALRPERVLDRQDTKWKGLLTENHHRLAGGSHPLHRFFDRRRTVSPLLTQPVVSEIIRRSSGGSLDAHSRQCFERINCTS